MKQETGALVHSVSDDEGIAVDTITSTEKDFNATITLDSEANVHLSLELGHPAFDVELGKFCGALQRYVGRPPVIDPVRSMQTFVEKHWNADC